MPSALTRRFMDMSLNPPKTPKKLGYVSKATQAAEDLAKENEARQQYLKNIQSDTGEAAPLAPVNVADINQRYELMRKRAEQTQRGQTQMEQEAMARKFTAAGMGQSGEAIKTQAKIGERGGQQIAALGENIEAQRASEIGQREFERSQLEAQQGFAASEAAKQRRYQAMSTLYGQDFAAGQAQKERAQKDKMFNSQMAFEKTKFKFDSDLATKNYDLDVKVTDFNMQMAKDAANRRSFMERLFDPIGWTGKQEKYSGKAGRWIEGEGGYTL